MTAPWSAEEFEGKLRGKSSSYHINHPFHVMMAEGRLSRSQLQGWVANRFITKSRSRSKMQQSCRTAMTARFAASGFCEFWTTTG